MAFEGLENPHRSLHWYGVVHALACPCYGFEGAEQPDLVLPLHLYLSPDLDDQHVLAEFGLVRRHRFDAYAAHSRVRRVVHVLQLYQGAVQLLEVEVLQVACLERLPLHLPLIEQQVFRED